MLRTFSVCVNDRTGVLNCVSSFLRRLGFSIQSLTVGHSGLRAPRATVGGDIEGKGIGQLEVDLGDLVDVRSAERTSEVVVIAHELALIKIRVASGLRVSLPEELVRQFRARVLVQGTESLVLEAVGTSEQIDVLVKILWPCGIIEIVRTRQVVMAAGPS
jgi:acetolactate synthase-1/3 small subunit